MFFPFHFAIFAQTYSVTPNADDRKQFACHWLVKQLIKNFANAERERERDYNNDNNCVYNKCNFNDATVKINE